MDPRVASLVTAPALVLWLAVCPPAVEAQTAAAAFVAAVRELAGTTLEDAAPGPAEQRDVTAARRTAIPRLQAALQAWDREIDTLVSRVTRELEEASRERAFQLHVELGMVYRQRGRLEDALRHFDAAAAVRPAASDVHLLRALTLETAGLGAETDRAFRTAWMRDPSNPAKAYLVLTRTNDLDPVERARAQHVLRDASERMLSNAHLPEGVPFPTLDLVPDTLSRTPIVGDDALAGVFTRLAEGRLDEAVAALRSPSPTATAAGDHSPLALFRRGQTAEAQGRVSDARRAYEAALAGTLAGRYMLYIGIGRLAQVEGELEAAIDAFGHAVRLNPNDPVVHRELAGAYAAAGRIDDAFAELVAGLLIDPADAETLAAIGQLHLDAGRAADAIPVLNRALQVKPDRFETHYALATALLRVGRTGDAAREFEQFERMSRQALELRRRQVTGEVEPERAER